MIALDGSKARLFLRLDQIALIRALAGEDFVVEILLPVDIGDALL